MKENTYDINVWINIFIFSLNNLTNLASDLDPNPYINHINCIKDYSLLFGRKWNKWWGLRHRNGINKYYNNN